MSILYISNYVLTLNQFKLMVKYNDHTLGSYIEYYLNDTLIITNLESIVKNKGYATILLLSVLQKAKNKNINVVELDDCSSNYNKKHNIYLKLGFKYINKYGPEMTGNINQKAITMKNEISRGMKMIGVPR